LLSIPKGGGWFDIVTVVFFLTVSLIAFAGAAEGWLWRKLHWSEIILLLGAGLLLAFHSPLNKAIAAVGFIAQLGVPAKVQWVGVALVAMMLLLQWRTRHSPLRNA